MYLHSSLDPTLLSSYYTISLLYFTAQLKKIILFMVSKLLTQYSPEIALVRVINDVHIAELAQTSLYFTCQQNLTHVTLLLGTPSSPDFPGATLLVL